MAYRGLTIIFASFLIFLGQFGYSNGACDNGCPDSDLGTSDVQRDSSPNDQGCYTEGTTVTLECTSPKILVGSSENTCTDGEWSNPDPVTCNDVYCSAPEVENLIPSPNQTTYGVGETVHFSCNVGYKFTPVSPRTAVCMNTGNLEPATGFECIVFSCPAPTNTNKDLTWSGKDVRATYMGDATITYSCSEGFKVEGSPNNTCIDDNQWENNDPTCIFAFNCSAPSNTHVNLTWTDKGQRETYYGNETITYSCSDGLKVDGSRENICTAQDNWKSDHPKCKSSGNVVQVIWYSLMMTTCYSLFSLYM